MYEKYMKSVLYQRDRVHTHGKLVRWREEALTDQRKNTVAVDTTMKEVHGFSPMAEVHEIIIQKTEAITQKMFISPQNAEQVQLQEGKNILTLLREDPERILTLEEI